MRGEKNMDNSWKYELKAHLAKNGMTSKEAAEKVGIKQGTFNSYMRGVRNPTLENQKKIHDELGFDIARAMYGDTYDMTEELDVETFEDDMFSDGVLYDR